jgi:hypothetical protein
VAQGLVDLAAGRVTEASLLVSIAAPRLEQLGFVVPSPIADPEERLYQLLEAEHGDAAHGRFNALRRRIVSFQRAAALVERTADA